MSLWAPDAARNRDIRQCIDGDSPIDGGNLSPRSLIASSVARKTPRYLRFSRDKPSRP